MDLDKEIVNIQRSTRTLFRVFAPIHDWLRLHNRLYYLWSTKSYSRVLHWAVLLLYIAALPAMFYSSFNVPQKSKAGNTQTYDFPRWEWANPSPTGNNLSTITKCSQDNSLWSVGNYGTILKSLDNGVTWQQSYTGNYNNLQDVICVSPSDIIAVGYSGTILQYNGLSWTQRTSNVGTSIVIFSVISLDSTHLVAVGDSGTVGTIIVSTDAGQTWATKSIGTTNYLDSVTALDSTHIIAVGNSGTIIVSTDAGQTWTTKNSGTTNYIYSVAILDSTHAIAVCDNGTITVSTDAGQTWTTKSSGTTNYLDSVTALDSTHLVAVGNSGTVTVSTDAGQTWATKNSGTTNNLVNVTALDSTHAIAVGYSGTITVSTDAGQTWTTKSSGTTNSLMSVTVLSPTHAVAVGTSGTITVSTDAGQTWVAESGGTINHLYGVTALDSTHAVAVGYRGTIAVSTDAGRTWATKNSGTTNSLMSVTALDSTHAIAIGSFGTIKISTDAGQTWATKNSGTTNSLGSVTALDSTHAIAVGSSGTITVSTDAGQTWATKNSGTTNSLYSVTALDSTHAVAVGTYGTISISTDAGQTWTTKSSGTTSYFHSVTALDSTHAITVSDSGAITVSTDAGQTWATKSSGTTNYLGSVIALDSTHVITVGNSGTIIVSTDAGQTWATKSSGTTNNLGSVTALDSTHAIAVGSSGTITVSTDAGQTWATKNSGTGGTSTLDSVITLDSTNAVTIGYNGTSIILYYTSPANATAIKLQSVLLGQSFADGSGVSGSPTTVQVGQTVPVSVYAVDNTITLDKGNASTIGLTSTDPKASNPAPLPLTQNNTCVQNRTDPTQSTCGIGSTNFVFHTPGTWNITASDVNGILTSGISSSVTVLPGAPVTPRLIPAKTSLFAGTSTKVTLGLADQFGNATSDSTTARIIHLGSSSTATNALFSTSPNGPWTPTLDITIPAGNATIDPTTNQAITFYYLDLTAGASSITANSDGLTTLALPVTVAAPTTDLSGSSITVTNNNPKVGDNVTVNVNLHVNGAVASGKAVSLSSSRSKDVITPLSSTTDSSGNISFTLTSNQSGSLTLSAINSDDNTWLSNQGSVTFLPDKVAKINLSTSNSITSVGAGASFNIIANFLDQYGNIATNSKDTIGFSSTDSNATLPGSHALTSSDSGEHIFTGAVLGTAGSQTITATDQNTNVTGSINLSVVPGNPSATKSTFDTGISSLVFGKNTTTLTVTLLDDFGNPISGKTIKISYDSSMGSLDKNQGVTDSNGKISFVFTPASLTNNNSNNVVFTALDETDNLTLNSKINITVLPDTLINQLTSTFANFAYALQQSPTAKSVANAGKSVSFIAAIIGFLPILANAVGSAPAAAHAATYGLSLGMETLGIKKKRKTWGRVFDSTTGKGVDLALVRLYDQGTMKLKGTIVTDIQGKYHFQIEPGNYVLTVSHKGYIFPTQIFAKYGIAQIDKTISKVNNQYVGQTISIGQDETLLNIEIPIDPAHKKVSSWLRFKITFSSLFETVLFSFSFILIPIFILSSLLSIFTAIILPDQRNIVLAILYSTLAAFYIVSRMVKNRHFSQVINRDTKKPISSVAVSLFDKEYGTLKETRITDRFGRFSIFAQKGEYYLKAEKDGCTFSTEKKHDKEIKITKGSKLIYKGENISLREPSFIGVVIEGKSERSEVL